MPGAWQQKKSTWDPTIVSAKDHIMASENARTTAIATLNLQLEIGKLTGETPRVEAKDVVNEVLALAKTFYDEHMARGGSVPAAVDNVVRQFPGAKATPAPSTGNADGSFVFGGGKHEGETIAATYTMDPTYLRNFIAGPKYNGPGRAETIAFLAQMDAAADEDAAYEEDPYS